MAKVPSNNVIPMRAPLPKVDDVYLAMAGAQMHAEGKFGPKPSDTIAPEPETVTGINKVP